MNFDAFQTYSGQAVVDFVKFYNSPSFFVIKFFLGVYAIIIIADIILLLIQRGMGGNFRETISGMNIPRELTTKKKKLSARWNQVRARLKSANGSEYKVAIIEADNIIDDLVKNMGYSGANMGERLDNIPEGQLTSVEELKKAHEIRNRIIHEENFQVSREYAKEILKKYETFLEEFEVL